MTAMSRKTEFEVFETAASSEFAPPLARCRGVVCMPHVQLPSSSIDRISKAEYRPTEMDILLNRIWTTGIVEVKFKVKNVDFRVYRCGRAAV